MCNERVELESSKTDEDGHAIHEECYLQKIHVEKIHSGKPMNPMKPD
jgi:hypothetical protein